MVLENIAFGELVYPEITPAFGPHTGLYRVGVKTEQSGVEPAPDRVYTNATHQRFTFCTPEAILFLECKRFAGGAKRAPKSALGAV
jgi:hypothetical protein